MTIIPFSKSGAGESYWRTYCSHIMLHLWYTFL